MQMFIAALFIIAKMSFTRKMDKQTVVYPDNGILVQKEMSYQAMGRHGGHLNAY